MINFHEYKKIYQEVTASLSEPDMSKRQIAFARFTDAMKVIEDFYDLRDEENNREIICTIASDISAMLLIDIAFPFNESGARQTTNDASVVVTANLLAAAIDGFLVGISTVSGFLDKAYMHKCVVDVLQDCLKCKLLKRSEIFYRRIRLWMKEANNHYQKMEEIEKYWDAHPQEKAAFYEEYIPAREELVKLQRICDSHPDVKHAKKITEELQAAYIQKSKIPMFNFKELKPVNQKIKDLRAILPAAEQARAEAVSEHIERMNALNKQLAQLNNKYISMKG